MKKNDDRTIYDSIICTYHKDKDACRAALGRLRRTVIDDDRGTINDAITKLAMCFDDFVETTGIILEVLVEAPMSVDDYLEATGSKGNVN